ncbi:MAG: cell wall hydrolase [Cetobacterium sp.]|uniref:cell wall hydrolase n=1 Tax=Cetobacterium sp. TaxID=2071632 RepID=UPI003EE72B75
MFEMLLLVLTLNLYMEAGGEGERGMEAVADVVVTRVMSDHYPDDAFEVVMQKAQFSWVREQKVKDFDDLMALQQRVLNKASRNPKSLEAYRRAEKIARKTLQTGYKPSKYYTHFHNMSVMPKWAKGRYGRPIGNHVFYRIVK